MGALQGVLSRDATVFQISSEIDVLSHLSTMLQLLGGAGATPPRVRKTPTWKCSGIGMNMFARNAAVGSIA